MTELLRTNDLVYISWVRATLDAHGIETLLLDQHVSVMEGSIGVLPRRLMVLEEDASRARWILEVEARALGDEGA